jgi:hypothetical protein
LLFAQSEVRNLPFLVEKDVTVKLKKRNIEYHDLTPGQSYVVIGIEADDYRILNDHGRPYLYPHDLFEIELPYEPGDWVTEIGDDGERYSYPPALNAPGFFEDFFDGKKEAIALFWRVINQRLALAS